MAALRFIGVQRIVVPEADVEPLDTGIITYSLAQPFLLAPPAGRSGPALQALTVDPVVAERVRSPGSPGLIVSRVLAELAFTRLEQPSVARSLVVPLPPGTPAAVVEGLLSGLGSGRPFAPLTLDGAFEHTVPLVDRGDNQVDRRLRSQPIAPLSAELAATLREARAELASFRTLVGAESPQGDQLGRQLLLATADRLTGSARRAHVVAVDDAIEAVTSQVSTPATFTLTLTAREGTIPLTIRNDSGLPLRVTVRMRSQKLQFPEGDVRELVLTEETTRVDLAVRARASGAFPLQVEVTSPDGRERLAATRYTVRSTAVSGAGLILSLGAGLFLVVWWARHWRRTRRSAKLVATTHPVRATPPAGSG